MQNSGMIGDSFAEYCALWHGECSHAVSTRMTEIERQVAAIKPKTLLEAKQQAAIALAATGSLDADPLLIPAVAKAA